jgi:hypothetical protein
MLKILTLILIFLPAGLYAQTVQTRSVLCAEAMKAGQPAKQIVPADGGAYVPGVDVRGKPVVSADVGGGLDLSSLQSTLIPIEVDLAERFGLTLAAGVELKPEVAALNIHQDGRIFFNDSDITRRVQTYCSEIETTDEKPLNNNSRGTGQSGSDLLILPTQSGDLTDDIPADQKLEGNAL